MENTNVPKVTMKELIFTYAPRRTHVPSNTNAPREVGKKDTMFFCICPFPDHTELTPSFSFKEDTFRCFGCGKSGDAVEFVKILFNISEEEARAKLTADFGGKDN